MFERITRRRSAFVPSVHTHLLGPNPQRNVSAGERVRSRKSAMPDWLSPMLATLTEERFSREGWLFEPKLDGERCLVFGRPTKVELFSRNQKLLNAKYPELVEAFEAYKYPCFIGDGEIVAFDKGV